MCLSNHIAFQSLMLGVCQRAINKTSNSKGMSKGGNITVKVLHVVLCRVQGGMGYTKIAVWDRVRYHPPRVV